MDIFPTVLVAAGVDLGRGYVVDGRDMLPALRGAPSQHEVFLHYCGFTIVAARVWGRWKVWWQMQVGLPARPPPSAVLRAPRTLF